MDRATGVVNRFRGSDEPSAARRDLLFAIIATSALLPAGVRDIVSLEATVGAVAVGILLGAVASTALRSVQLQYDDDIVTMVVIPIVALVFVAIATVLIWLVVPREHISTFIQFTLAFVWSMTLADVARHLVWPAVAGSRSSTDQ